MKKREGGDDINQKEEEGRERGLLFKAGKREGDGEEKAVGLPYFQAWEGFVVCIVFSAVNVNNRTDARLTPHAPGQRNNEKGQKEGQNEQRRRTRKGRKDRERRNKERKKAGQKAPPLFQRREGKGGAYSDISNNKLKNLISK